MDNWLCLNWFSSAAPIDAHCTTATFQLVSLLSRSREMNLSVRDGPFHHNEMFSFVVILLLIMGLGSKYKSLFDSGVCSLKISPEHGMLVIQNCELFLLCLLVPSNVKGIRRQKPGSSKNRHSKWSSHFIKIAAISVKSSLAWRKCRTEPLAPQRVSNSHTNVFY